MKKNVRFAALAVVLAAIGAGLWIARSKPEKSKTVAIAYQSNRSGDLEPCTCDMNPFGGIDREWNALQELKKSADAVVVVDAGNMLAPPRIRGTIEQAREKARFVTSMVKELGVEVFAPGPNDYALGLETVEQTVKTLGVQAVSTNLTRGNDGDPIFAPYVVQEKGGVRFVFVSLSPAVPGLGHQTPEEALKKWLPQAKTKGDIIVLLSQLPTLQTERLLKSNPDIQLVIGADNHEAFTDAVWYREGSKLLVDPANSGHFLGVLKIHPELPLRGFYSRARVDKNIAQKQTLEAKLAIPTEAAAAQSALNTLQRFEPLEALKGGTTYEHELVALSPQRYGQENALTKQIKERKAQLKKSAIDGE